MTTEKCGCGVGVAGAIYTCAKHIETKYSTPKESR